MNDIYPSDFRMLLAEELERRCHKNPNYSLRSFAKTLGVGSSFLSKLIHYKRPVTEPTLLKLGAQLQLEPETIERYRKVLRSKRGRSAKAGTPTPVAYQEIDLDRLRILSDWYNLAILEVMKLDDFRPEVSWVATRLQLSPNVVQAAIERLLRLGLLAILPDGRWEDRAGATTSGNDLYSDLAARRHQQQILELASRAVVRTPTAERSQSAMLMAISKGRLDEARAMIAKFRRELCEFLESGEQKDDVYYLSVSLFPVTENPSTPNGGTK